MTHLSPTSARRFDRAKWWTTALILLPLLLMTGIGVRGIVASRRDALESARAEAGRAIDFAVRRFEEKLTPLRSQARVLRLYPSVPQPVEASEAAALYAQANAATPADAEPLYLAILSNHPDATTATGLPCAPLIAWSRLKACDDHTELESRIQTLGQSAVDTHPSILTPELLSRAQNLAVERGARNEPMAHWQRRWDEDEVIRTVVEADTTGGVGAATPRWIARDKMRWWLEPAPGDLRIVSAGEFTALAESVNADTKALLPPSTALAIRWAGHSLIGGQQTGQALSERESGPLSIVASLADPTALYRQQRWQTIWLASLLGLGLLAALGGFYLMQRALTSERHLNEKKSDFVASVSHELRAPVASMRLMLENLDSGAVKTDESRREYLNLLGGECRRLSALIENVLDFARIEHDRKIYHMAEADVPALVHDAIQLLQPKAAQKRQSIQTELTPIEPIPQIDALAIQQALINLVDNAIKFSPEDTVITVKVGPLNAAAWQIIVADQGHGIPKHEHTRIFERFYRIGSELCRQTQGSGIGLSIVKHTVEAHRGSIEIESAPGAGSKFTLSFPCSAPSQA